MCIIRGPNQDIAIKLITVSKIVCLQIIEQLRKGFTVLKDHNTIYRILRAYSNKRIPFCGHSLKYYMSRKKTDNDL